VLISRLRMAASSSERTFDCPCIDVPPVIFTFVFEIEGAGEDVREGFRDEEFDFEVLKSEIRGPAAEGGCLGVGAWMAAGLTWRVKALLGCVGAFEVDGMGFLVIYSSSSLFLMYAVPWAA
jgi:hypothetical protein